jgi:7,8-dihydropterin-6-yl-methyl-4-(beta-D-ribofuranosyl)aminobenzene 5'-phosphate synthase
MKLEVLFDKEALNERFVGGWGLSYLLDGKILFDAGEKFEYIEHNAIQMCVDLLCVEKVVLSHAHWDHISGLWRLLENKPGLTVYIPANFPAEVVDRIKKSGGKPEVTKEFSEIDKNVFSTGGITTLYNGQTLVEQAVVVKSRQGMSLLVGCSHPGILKIVERVRGFFHGQGKLVILAGGLHLLSQDQRSFDYIAGQLVSQVQKIAPAHCSGHEACEVFKKVFGERCVGLKTGMRLEI